MITLRSCPFCAEAHPDKVVVNEIGRLRRVYCHNCGAAGPIADTDQLAAEAWNSRNSD